LEIIYDDATGEVNLHVRCWVKIPGFKDEVSHSLEMTPPPNAAAILQGVLNSSVVNVDGKDVPFREAMEAETVTLAVNHVAAVTRKVQPGIKRVYLGGNMSPFGQGAVQKQ
jgi:hypothetical protein